MTWAQVEPTGQARHIINPSKARRRGRSKFQIKLETSLDSEFHHLKGTKERRRTKQEKKRKDAAAWVEPKQNSREYKEELRIHCKISNPKLDVCRLLQQIYWEAKHTWFHITITSEDWRIGSCWDCGAGFTPNPILHDFLFLQFLSYFSVLSFSRVKL